MIELLPTTEPAATLFKITLILFIGLVGHRLLRTTSAGIRHLWSTLAIAALVAVPLLSAALPGWDVTLPAVPSNPTEAVRSVPFSPAPVSAESIAASVEPSKLVSSTPAKVAPFESAALAPTPSGESSTASSFEAARATVASSQSPAPLFLVWAGVALLLLARLSLGALRVLGWIARGETPKDDRLAQVLDDVVAELGTRKPRLLLSEHSRVPLLWGFARPTLLLPRAANSWTEERLRVVLLHELAHLDRGDWLTLLAGRIAVALYWFHPLAWMLESQARRDCEEACDDRVLAAGTRPSDYAQHLLDLASGLNQDAPRPAVALIRRSQVDQRLRSILHPDRPRRSPSRGLVLLAASLLTLVVVPLASVRLQAWDPGPANQVSFFGESPDGSDFVPAADEVSFGHRVGDVVHGQLAQVFHSPDDEKWAVESRKRDRRRQNAETGHDWWEVAYDYHRAEDFEQATEAFEKAAAAGYRPGTASYNAACGYARLGRHADAMYWLDRAFEAGFDSYDLLFEDSDLDSLRGTSDFTTLLDRYRDESGSRWHPAQDRLEQTEAAYQKLMSVQSQNGDHWHQVGSDFLSLGRYDRAIECLQRSVELDPQRSSATRYNLACTYSRAGQVERALATLDDAVEWGFDSEERFRNDRDLDAIRGTAEFEEIRRKAEILDLSQFRRDGWWDRDREIDPRRWQPAVDTYRTFVDQYPDHGRGWFNLGYSLHYAGQHEEAIRAFERAIQRDYKPSLQMYNIACAHSRLGNTESALTWLEKAGEAGMSIASSMDDDPDFDAIRDDERFKELERTYWVKEKRRGLIEHKEHLEEMLRQLGDKGYKVRESEAELHALKMRLETEEKVRDRERARLYETQVRLQAETERQAARQAQLEERTAQRKEAEAAALAELAAELEQRRAELEQQKAELEAARAQLADD